MWRAWNAVIGIVVIGVEVVGLGAGPVLRLAVVAVVMACVVP